MSTVNNIGEMDRPITIYQVTEGKGAMGSATDVEQVVKDVWAKRITGNGSEQFEEKVFTLDNRQYLIHYDPEIAQLFQEKLIVVDEGRKYFVFASEEIVRGRFVVLKTEYRA